MSERFDLVCTDCMKKIHIDTQHAWYSYKDRKQEILMFLKKHEDCNVIADSGNVVLRPEQIIDVIKEKHEIWK